MNKLDDYIASEDALFHYTRCAIALEKILHDGKFKLSSLINANDPREYKFKLYGAIGWGNFPPDFEKKFHDIHPILDKALRIQCKVMCCCSNLQPHLVLENGSIVTDTYSGRIGWAKSRMWAQYGDNHGGICLVFSKDEVRNSMLAQIPSEYCKSEFVRYRQGSRQGSKAMILDGDRLITEKNEEYAIHHIMSNATELLFTKDIDYRDESEFRFVLFDSENKLEFLDITSSIRAVIVGDRTPEVYYSTVNELCARYGIQCRRAYWTNSGMRLVLCKAK